MKNESGCMQNKWRNVRNLINIICASVLFIEKGLYNEKKFWFSKMLLFRRENVFIKNMPVCLSGS